ncbi:MAG: cell division protein ZipA C-terminal FtsZ-binding domain-containing protein [Burkholderiales bacterium]|nr:cell division protein ZipA C-terminal FtsZ-binding domain-containing protein [Burkholderiales bacterium]
MITSLQITLAIVGVLLIIAVVAYNLWQERKYRQEANRLFHNRREDILLGEKVNLQAVRPATGPVASAPEPVVPGPQPAAAAPAGEVGHEPAAPRPSAPVAQVPSPPSPDTRNRVFEDDDVPIIPSHAQTVLKTSPPASASPAAAEPRAAAAAGSGTPGPQAPSAVGFQTESGLDPAIEYIARMRFAEPTSANLGPLIEGLRKIGKPLRIMGKRQGQGWELIGGHPSQPLEAIEFGIQLADRSGAITSAQLERFCKLLYDFAAAEGGAVSCPDKQAAAQQAKELDQFCLGVDVIIGLTVVARGSRRFRSEDIHRLATEAGLVLGRDGVYYLYDEQGRPQFSLANQEETPFPAEGAGITTSGVTLVFDIPRVHNGLAVFDRMTELGLHLAKCLDGQLVDDKDRAVTRDSLQRDRARLAEYYAHMASRGIEAGGERALRLFV